MSNQLGNEAREPTRLPPYRVQPAPAKVVIRFETALLEERFGDDAIISTLVQSVRAKRSRYLKRLRPTANTSAVEWTRLSRIIDRTANTWRQQPLYAARKQVLDIFSERCRARYRPRTTWIPGCPQDKRSNWQMLFPM